MKINNESKKAQHESKASLSIDVEVEMANRRSEWNNLKAKKKSSTIRERKSDKTIDDDCSMLAEVELRRAFNFSIPPLIRNSYSIILNVLIESTIFLVTALYRSILSFDYCIIASMDRRVLITLKLYG